MKFISVGATRYVLIVCGYALKFPRASSWRSFLAGLLHNMNERAFSRMNIDLLCPIVASPVASSMSCQCAKYPLIASRFAFGVQQQSSMNKQMFYWASSK